MNNILQYKTRIGNMTTSLCNKLAAQNCEQIAELHYQQNLFF